MYGLVIVILNCFDHTIFGMDNFAFLVVAKWINQLSLNGKPYLFPPFLKQVPYLIAQV